MLPGTPPFAAVDTSDIAAMVVGFGFLVVVPVVAMLLAHQRKMAELVRGQAPDADLVRREIEVFRAQLAELRSQLHEHIFRTDPAFHAPETPPPLHERING